VVIEVTPMYKEPKKFDSQLKILGMDDDEISKSPDISNSSTVQIVTGAYNST